LLEPIGEDGMHTENARWVELGDDHGIRAMCDYGAEAFRKDKRVVLRLRIMPNEVAEVKAYMADWHPSVPFILNYPTWTKDAR
jgi:hypothetical protein